MVHLKTKAAQVRFIMGILRRASASQVKKIYLATEDAVKFERCVRRVKRTRARNSFAVCTAAVRR